MPRERVTITQRLPDGDIQVTNVDVLASGKDSALAMVFKWYDQQTHFSQETQSIPSNVVSMSAYRETL